MASKPVSVISVAKYILHQQGEMSAMKLQKLCYYSQAWHMAWEDKALFDEDFQAWANGPVCRPLYDKHQGEFILKKDFFDTEQTEELKEDQKESINMVLEFYGSKSPQWLRRLRSIKFKYHVD
jgi:uncharacterized phage-associated protein